MFLKKSPWAPVYDREERQYFLEPFVLLTKRKCLQGNLG